LRRGGPGPLKDKELYLWVTYPEPKGRKTKKSKKAGSPRKDLKLWAVLIIEDLKRIDAFTCQVTLRRIFKRDERWIKVWVSNDPGDQSDDAGVFGFVSPHPRLLTALERYLVHVAARRVYDAIAETWSDSEMAVRSVGR